MAKPQEQIKVTTTKAEQRIVHLNVPTSTHYITFPLDLSRHITITWSEDNRNRYGYYYYGKCYFGNLVDENDLPVVEKLDFKSSVQNELFEQNSIQYLEERKWPRPKFLVPSKQGESPRKLKICGEATIFVASEFLEMDTVGGPLDRYHFRSDQNKIDSGGKAWITVQLNSCFEYGQKDGTFTNLERFIVYHPRIYSWMMPRMMFQHRFMTALEHDTLKEAGQQPAVQVSAASPSFTGRIFGMAAKATAAQVKINVGHTLHQYLSNADVFKAEEVAVKIKQPVDAYYNYEKKVLRKVEDEDAITLRHEAESRRVAALQIVEQTNEKIGQKGIHWGTNEKDSETQKLLNKLAASPGVLVTMSFPPQMPAENQVPEKPAMGHPAAPQGSVEEQNPEKARAASMPLYTGKGGPRGSNAIARNLR